MVLPLHLYLVYMDYVVQQVEDIEQLVSYMQDRRFQEAYMIGHDLDNPLSLHQLLELNI